MRASRSPEVRPVRFGQARQKADAYEALECALSWLEELGRMDLGHDGDHAAGEALRNARAVLSYLEEAA